MEKEVKVFLKIGKSGEQKLEKIVGIDGLAKKEALLFASCADVVFVGNYRYKKIRDFADSDFKVKEDKGDIFFDFDVVGKILDGSPYRVLVYRRHP